MTLCLAQSSEIMLKNHDFPTIQILAQSRADLFCSNNLGENREMHRRCQLSATNDVEAILCWLNEYRTIATTYRTYQKEAERFLLWCIYKQNKLLSSINRNDLEAYRQFLTQPDLDWCAPKGYKRGTSGWRPFVGGLKPSAQHQAFVILQSLFVYLYDANYLAENPLQLIRKRADLLSVSKRPPQRRLLEDEEWEALLQVIEGLSNETEQVEFKNKRLKIILYMFYFLGIRVSELVQCKWSDFVKINDDWWLFVTGKGNKAGKVPVNDELFLAIAEYRIFLRKSLEPQPDETEFVLTKYNNKEASITTRYVNYLLKELSQLALQQFIDQPHRIARLKAFSAHWLRHFSGTMQDRVGIKDTHIKENHRHAKIDTTRQYIHAIDHERHREMNKLKLRPKIYQSKL